MRTHWHQCDIATQENTDPKGNLYTPRGKNVPTI